MDAATLGQLRTIIHHLQHANSNGGTSLREVVEVARQVQMEAGVTVDFEATQDLGQPLIVLRLPPAPRGPLAGLTPRELQVAALVTDGLSNKEIARQLHLTVGTVKHYVHQILEKTELPSRVAIATRLSARGS